MEAEVFGAFTLAFDTRVSESAMTQTQLAERLGKDKTGTSKLLSAPRNWTIRTISDLAVALNVVVEFSLRDRVNPDRVFMPTGVNYIRVPAEQTDWSSPNKQQLSGILVGNPYGFINASPLNSAWTLNDFSRPINTTFGQIGFSSSAMSQSAKTVVPTASS